MIDHMLFHNACWIQKTDDVANKLTNYDNLQNQVWDLNHRLSSIKGTWIWSRNNNSSFNGGKDMVKVNVTENGVTVDLVAHTGNLGNITLKKS